MCDELVSELTEVLDSFSGDESLREIFWSILSYDQQRLPLSKDWLRRDVSFALTRLELFATHDSISVVLAETTVELAREQIESLCSRLELRFSSLVLVLHVDALDAWTIIYPDRARKHHLRFLRLPGPELERRATVKALAALTTVDWSTEETLRRLDVAHRLDIFFPGGMPKQRWEFDPAYEDEYRNSFLRHKAAPVADLYEDIAHFPLLTEQQERGEDLDEEDGGDEEMSDNRRRLVLHNIRLVIHIALKFPTNVLELEDLVQEGVLGLMTAARKFEPGRNARFSTYAWYWIRQAMFRAIANNQNLIRWPVHRLDDLIPANRNGKAYQLTPGERRVKHFADGLPRAEDAVEYADGDTLERLEVIEAVRSTMKAALHKRQRRVLEMRFGFGKHHEHTLEDIGQVEGVTRERIRQIQGRATDRLKHWLPPWLRRQFEGPSPREAPSQSEQDP